MKYSDTPFHSRRHFVKQTGLLIGAAPLLAGFNPIFQGREHQINLKVHLFSKHVQFLNYEEMAAQIAAAGFDGVDLTVRKGGHVEPENVARDLPSAIQAIREAGLSSVIMATDVNDASDPVQRRVLEVAADQGITHYRMQYYNYQLSKSIPQSIELAREKMTELADLNQKLGIVGMYQNHAGTRMGSSIWELYFMLEGTNERNIGAQYDIRHATVEGGLNWSRGLELIKPRIRSLALKDFIWAQSDGKWRAENVPLGEGMVDWKAYLRMIKAFHIDIPVSLHLEYPLGGAERGRRELTADPQIVYDAMKKDLNTFRQLWKEA